MASALDDPAVVQHHDLVGMHQRRQAVGNDYRGLGRGGLGKTLPHLALGHRVDGRRAIVEDYHARSRRHAARDAHPLALTAGERHAAFADPGLVGFGKPRDVLVDLGGLGGADDPLILGPGVGIGDVVAHGGIEQERLLLHQPDVFAKTGEGDLADVAAVQRDPSAGHVVEAWDQVRQGRLAAAGRSDDAKSASRPHLEADVAQHRLAARIVREIHMLEPQHPLWRVQRCGARGVGDHGLEVEDLEQPRAGRGPPRHGVRDHGDLPDRRL